MKYRAEIDGLRALAVVPVILFHAGFEWFSGGFVGVDVFFVISGYLITTILIEDLENNQFSIVKFYERRARRILPALFFVMLTCIPFAWAWMIPSQMKDFSQSLVAVSLFVSNILFWLKSGYFEAEVEEKPLLHTWSLAVEEQYYVLFPIFLFFAWRFGKNRVFWMIAIMAAISLVLSEWGWRKDPSANFYLAPTRVWELFAGSIAAFIAQKRGVQSNNTLSILGLAAIAFAIFVYDETTPFPSMYTLVPVLGVVLLILYANNETLVARLLSIKLIVGIGLISYSAYLWHQPLFAFARIKLDNDVSSNLLLFLSMVSLLLAAVSWMYVEKPFRSKTASKISTAQIFGGSILGLFAFIGIGLIGHINNGYSNRIKGWDELVSIPNVTTSYCHNSGRRTEAQLLENDFCIIGEGEVKLIIIGDSHAGALFDYADKYLTEKGISSLAVSGGYCAPLLNGFAARSICEDTIEIAFQRVLKDDKISKVVLVAEWAIYTQGFRGRDAASAWRDNDGLAVNPTDNPILFRRSFDKTVSRLLNAGKKVLIVHPVPEFDHYPYIWLSSQVLRGNFEDTSAAAKTLPTISTTKYNKRNSEVFEVFDDYKDRLSYLSMKDLFCHNGECRQYDKGSNILYSDFNHVNYFGAKLIVDKIGSEFLDE